MEMLRREERIKQTNVEKRKEKKREAGERDPREENR